MDNEDNSLITLIELWCSDQLNVIRRRTMSSSFRERVDCWVLPFADSYPAFGRAKAIKQLSRSKTIGAEKGSVITTGKPRQGGGYSSSSTTPHPFLALFDLANGHRRTPTLVPRKVHLHFCRTHWPSFSWNGVVDILQVDISDNRGLEE